MTAYKYKYCHLIKCNPTPSFICFIQENKYVIMLLKKKRPVHTSFSCSEWNQGQGWRQWWKRFLWDSGIISSDWRQNKKATFRLMHVSFSDSRFRYLQYIKIQLTVTECRVVEIALSSFFIRLVCHPHCWLLPPLERLLRQLPIQSHLDVHPERLCSLDPRELSQKATS